MTSFNELLKRPMFKFLMLMTIASMGGLQVWRTLFNNFAVEVAKLNGAEVGVITAVREIPGFLAFLVIYIIIIIREQKFSAFSIIILGIGLILTGYFPSFLGLAFTTFIMSVGFHYYETTNQSLTLQYFDNKTSPIVFGRLRSIAALSSIFGSGLVFLLSYVLDFKPIYLILGLIVVFAGIWGICQNPIDKNIVPQTKKLVLKGKYWLFYILTCLSGARRQIFVTFAVFLLVAKFNYSVREITILFIVNNIVNFFISPVIGRAINHFGERAVLSLEYFSLVWIFIGYAFVESRLIVAFLYILDHIFFNFSIGIRTYFQKIGDKEDFASTMAVGFTINHIIAIILPLVGGALWMIDYRYPFFIGAAISVLSLVFVQKVRLENV